MEAILKELGSNHASSAHIVIIYVYIYVLIINNLMVIFVVFYSPILTHLTHTDIYKRDNQLILF